MASAQEVLAINSLALLLTGIVSESIAFICDYNNETLCECKMKGKKFTDS